MLTLCRGGLGSSRSSGSSIISGSSGIEGVKIVRRREWVEHSLRSLKEKKKRERKRGGGVSKHTYKLNKTKAYRKKDTKSGLS